MGFAIAAEAARRGAQVVLVAGPVALDTPTGVRRIDVGTALEMREAIQTEYPASTVVIMAAAVADYRAAAYSEQKISKSDLPKEVGLNVSLVENPDILAELCRDKQDRVIIGFAAESQDLITRARQKVVKKGCDLLVANDISVPGSGFDSDTNTVVFVAPNGEIEELPSLPKSTIASQLLDRVGKLRGEKK
jgi:phosphopantothenoylcysteine decarboxylase/phosphopantothenate--cysteine ligase